MKVTAYLISNAQQLMETAEQNEKLALKNPLTLLTAEYTVYINIDHITFAFLIEDDKKIKCVIGGTELILKNESEVWNKIKKHLKKIAKK